MGWWNFERLYVDDFSASHIAYEGRYVWALSGSTIRIYDVYDLEKYLPIVDQYMISEPHRSLSVPEPEFDTPSTYREITIPQSCEYIVCANGKAYVASGVDIFEVNINGTIIAIDQPLEMMSNIHCYNNKLWLVSKDVFNEEHLVFNYDLKSKIWDYASMPSRKQISTSFFISDDKAGHLLVTNYNNLSIGKFNSSTGAFDSTVRLDDGSGANRGPHIIHTNSSLVVYVASVNGMISTINTTSDVVNHVHNSLSTAGGMVDDGTYLWFSAGELVRSRKLDNDIRLTNGDEPDYSFNDVFPPGEFTDITKTISHSYETKDGTKFVGEYIFMIKGTSIVAFRNDDRYFRNVYAKVDGVGMIASGQHNYTGD